jgi:acyl carrier protein
MLDEKFDEILRRQLPFVTPKDTLTEDTKLRDFGLDSMGTVQLIADLETEYGIRFVDDLLSLDTFATPGMIWAGIAEMGAITS